MAYKDLIIDNEFECIFESCEEPMELTDEEKVVAESASKDLLVDAFQCLQDVQITLEGVEGKINKREILKQKIGKIIEWIRKKIRLLIKKLDEKFKILKSKFKKGRHTKEPEKKDKETKKDEKETDNKEPAKTERKEDDGRDEFGKRPEDYTIETYSIKAISDHISAIENLLRNIDAQNFSELHQKVTEKCSEISKTKAKYSFTTLKSSLEQLESRSIALANKFKSFCDTYKGEHEERLPLVSTTIGMLTGVMANVSFKIFSIEEGLGEWKLEK